MIHSAVLLAAGRGKRQRPYTDSTPKPLLEVDGRPTLDYVLRAARKAGVERVCIVTQYLEEQIFAYVGDGSRWGLEASFAHQVELRGSGDALRSVPLDWIRDEPVMVVATDYILEEDSLAELVRAHAAHRADMTMSLKACPVEELMARCSVEVDAAGWVSKIIEKPQRDEILSPFAASIMFIFPPQIWAYLRKITPSPRGEVDMHTAVEMMLEEGLSAYGVLQEPPREWSAPDGLSAPDASGKY